MTIVAPLQITKYRSKEAVTSPEQETLTWEALTGWLTNVERTDRPKDSLPGWSPHVLHTPHRKNAHVESVTLLVLDVDDATVVRWRSIRETLNDAGTAYAYHSTYSYSPVDGELRYRVIVPLSRPVTAPDWPRFFVYMADLLDLTPADAKQLRKCKDAARFFYAPFCPADGPEPDAGVADGDPLNVDEILADAPARSTLAAAEKLATALALKDIKAILPRSLANLPNGDARGYAALRLALNNEPFAVAGDRDNTLLAMSGVLAARFPNFEPAAIVAPLWHALDLDDPEPGWAPNALITKIERDQARLDAERAERETEREQREAQIAEQQQEWIRALTKGRRSTPLTSDEFAALAKSEKITEAQLRGRLLARVGELIYVMRPVFDDHGAPTHVDYGREVSVRHFETDMVQDLALYADVGVTVDDRDKHEVLKDYGIKLDAVTIDLTAERAHVDVDRSRFVQAPLRRVEGLAAEYSPGVDSWLRGLTGYTDQCEGSERDDYDRLVTWLAHSPRRDKPDVALWLHGPKNTGKSALAKDLSRGLYGVEPADYQRTAGAAFNEKLLRTLIVCSDETGIGDAIQQFKVEVTNGELSIRQKFKGSIDAKGAQRIMLLSNNDSEVFDAAARQTKEDIAALASRLLVVKVRDDGPRPVEAWIESNTVAKHVLWLAENLPGTEHYRPGSRFLTEASETAVRSILAGVSSWGSAVYSHVVRALERGPTSAGQSAVKIKNGVIYVSLSRLAGEQVRFSAFDHLPRKLSEADMRKAVEPLLAADQAEWRPQNSKAERKASGGELRPGRYKALDMELFARWYEAQDYDIDGIVELLVA